MQKKRAQKITGRLLGKITETEGFVASSPKQMIETKIIDIPVKEENAGQFIFDLKKYFQEEWEKISIAAFFRLLYQSPLKKYAFSNAFFSDRAPSERGIIFSTEENETYIGACFAVVLRHSDEESAF